MMQIQQVITHEVRIEIKYQNLFGVILQLINPDTYVSTHCTIFSAIELWVQQSLCVPHTHEAVSARYVTDDNKYRYADS